MKNENTMTIKTYRLDPIAPPKLTDEAKARYDTTDYENIGDMDWEKPNDIPD